MSMIATGSNEISEPDLTHVHVCVHCGRTQKREEIGNQEVGSGILHCPKCGLDCPLDIGCDCPAGIELLLHLHGAQVSFNCAICGQRMDELTDDGFCFACNEILTSSMNPRKE